MSNGININISGGNANFGNVVQGSGNTVKAELSSELRQAAEQRQESSQSTQALLERVTALEKLLAEHNAQSPSVKSMIESIRSQWGWAIPLIKKALGVVYPAIANIL